MDESIRKYLKLRIKQVMGVDITDDDIDDYLLDHQTAYIKLLQFITRHTDDLMFDMCREIRKTKDN